MSEVPLHPLGVRGDGVKFDPNDSQDVPGLYGRGLGLLATYGIRTGTTGAPRSYGKAPPLGPPHGPRDGRTVGSYGGVVS